MKIQCQLPIKVAVRSEAVLIEFTPACCLFSILYSSMHCNYKWHLSPVKHSESLTLFHQNVLFVYRLKTWPTGPWNLPLIKSQFFSLGRTKREYTCDVLWQGVSSWLYLCVQMRLTARKLFFFLLSGKRDIFTLAELVTSCTVLLLSRVAHWLSQFGPQTHLILITILICESCGMKQQTSYYRHMMMPQPFLQLPECSIHHRLVLLWFWGVCWRVFDQTPSVCQDCTCK